MHVVLGKEEQNRPEAYPQWCNLSWFHDCRGLTGDVKPHYHDAAEIWLWHEGGADGVVDGEEVSLDPGVMVYTPAGCLHAYRARGRHSNTGILPRRESWMRAGHLHVDQTGEDPSPEMPAFHFLPQENTPQSPAVFPPGAFLKAAYRGHYEAGAKVLDTVPSGWLAILVREGRLAATLDGSSVVLNEPELLIIGRSSAVTVAAETASELAFAVGWPPDEEGKPR